MARRIETGSIDIDAIKDQYPLADEVRRHLVLKRRGLTLVGLCPFHTERTPSFTVYAQEERFHCFGCGANGDIFDFLQHQAGLDIRTAAEHLTGGTLPVLSEARVAELKERQARFEAEQVQRRKVAAEQMRLRWEAADPGYSSHPYLTAKGIGPNGTRLDREHVLVPLVDTDGALRSLQSIDPTGHKLFEADLPVAGTMFVIGPPLAQTRAPVLLCEGFATGATLYETTGRTVVVAFNASNLVKVAERLISAYPAVFWQVAGDDDRQKATNVGRGAAIQAARVLRCDAVFPVFLEGHDGTDFNDMAAHSGAEAVRNLVVEGSSPDDLAVVDAFDFAEADIPVRPWLVPGAILSGYTHILAAPGGTGKSLFTLQFAIALAAGMQWGMFTPRRRCRSLVINVEDDLDEQRRRLAAAARVMGVDPQTLRGWIYLVDTSQGVVVAAHDPVKRSLVMTPVAGKLRELIKKHAIDVLWADPFAETFEGDENDNSEVKWAMKIWRDEVARATKSAVYLVHHTTKHAGNGAGDANVIRGAGAIVNSTRISATLMPMTADEATAIGVEQTERHLYVRYDDAKANQSLKTDTARWLRKKTVVLNNGIGLQEPDEVGALVPWMPPDAFDGLSLASIGMVLDRVEEGMTDSSGAVTGVRFTASAKGGSKDSGRWVGCLFMELLGMKEAQAKKVIGTWLATGVLVEQNYHCPERRRDRAGLFAPYDKRPGATS